MQNVTKKLQQVFKYIGYFIFKIFYGKINNSIDCDNNEKITVNEVILEKKLNIKFIE